MKQDVKEIYLDNHILVLNKQAGLLTQPNETDELSLEDLGKIYIKKRFQKPGNVFLEAIHRIDRPVSGLVLFARTSKSLSRLKKSLREGKFSKQYIAVVEGNVVQPEGELHHHLIHDYFCARVCDGSEWGAKSCRLKYTVIKKANGYTLLHIFLYTGRYHQIRAQLAAIGHPIVGDRKYGSKKDTSQILLHHYQLGVPHPISSEIQVWRADFFDHWPSTFLIPS